MHILVTTAGVLPPEPVADFAALMLCNGGSVTVMSVVQAPREFLQDLVSEEWRPFEDEEKPDAPVTEDDSEVERYINERGTRLVAPVVAALITRGFDPATVFVEGDEVAAAIVGVADDIGAETIFMGATRQLFTDSAWTSVSMQVAAASKLPVMLIPAPPRQPADTNGDYGEPEEPSAPETDA